MTQKLELSHLIEAAAWLQSSPSFSITEICSVPCDLSKRLPLPDRAKGKDLNNTDFTIESDGVSVTVSTLDIHNPLSDGWLYTTVQRKFRSQSLDSVKTDCKYYSGERLLFCAVNTKCEGCVDYCPKVESDRYE